MVVMEPGKGRIIIALVARKEKYFIKNMNYIDSIYIILYSSIIL